MNTVLRTADLHVSLGGTPALKGVGLRVEEGEKVALLGPNGSGKTTLLRVLAGIAPPTSGRATLRGRDLREIPDGRRARILAFLAQEEHTDLPFTARDVLLLARSVGLSDWRPYRRADHEAVEALARQWELTGLLDRTLQDMSGGERKRVLLARTFAQDTAIIVLDEPTNHLDLRHQHEMVARVVDSGRTVLMSLHDLDMAAAYCERVVLMSRGRIVADGAPSEVLTARIVEEVYGVSARRADVDGRVRLLVGR